MAATDLQIVAQYAKSRRDAPSEVYNAACRLLAGPDRTPSEDTTEGMRRRVTEAIDLTWAPEDGFAIENAADAAMGIVSPELKRLRAERDALKAAIEKLLNVAIDHSRRADKAEATIAHVWRFAEELRSYCSPHGVAADYANRLETVLRGAESHGDGR